MESSRHVGASDRLEQRERHVGQRIDHHAQRQPPQHDRAVQGELRSHPGAQQFRRERRQHQDERKERAQDHRKASRIDLPRAFGTARVVGGEGREQHATERRRHDQQPGDDLEWRRVPGHGLHRDERAQQEAIEVDQDGAHHVGDGHPTALAH